MGEPGFRSKTKVKNSEHKKFWDEVSEYENFLLSAEKNKQISTASSGTELKY